jgi:magnesium-transporting ATPase (P-type)
MRSEALLATAVGRLRWATSHLLFAVVGPAVTLAAAGLVAGLTYGLSTGDVGEGLPRVLASTVVQLPAVWVLAGIAAALFGLLPRLTFLSWATLVAFGLLNLFGDRSVFRINPFSNPFLLLAALAALVVHVAALYLPPTQLILRVEPIELEAWIRITLVASTIIAAMELHKYLRRGRQARITERGVTTTCFHPAL